MNKREIEIGGKTRVVRFGLKTIGDCIKHFDNNPEEFISSLVSNPFESVPLLFYYGLKYGEEREGRVPDFDINDVLDWLEEEGLQTEKVDEVTKAFIRSLYDNVPAIKAAVDADEEVKKNLIGV